MIIQFHGKSVAIDTTRPLHKLAPMPSETIMRMHISADAAELAQHTRYTSYCIQREQQIAGAILPSSCCR